MKRRFLTGAMAALLREDLCSHAWLAGWLPADGWSR